MRLTRVVIISLAAAACLVTGAAPSTALPQAPPPPGSGSDGGTTGGAVSEDNGAGRFVQTPARPGSGRRGGRHEINHGDPCGGGQTWQFRPTSPALNSELHRRNGTVPAAGSWVYMRCGGGPERIVWSRNLDADPGAVARDIVDSVAPPAPGVRFSPEGDQLVGLETWLWVDNWDDFTPPPLVLDGVSVSVTFSPRSTEWVMGDGSPMIECAGPGTPYDTSRPAAEQTTDCSHTYKRSTARQADERYHGTATIVWEVTFTVSNQAGSQSLDPVRTSQPFALRVAESQALVGR